MLSPGIVCETEVTWGRIPPELDLGGCAVDVPETRYAKLGRHRIAYQVVTGEGPLDVLFVPPAGDCIDLRWEWPSSARILRRLASLGRLIQRSRQASRGWPATAKANWFGLTLTPSWIRWSPLTWA